MTTLIIFAPIVGYFLFASIMFMFKKFIFELHASVLTLALIANFFLSVNTGINLLIMILQTVLAIAAFVLMVPFFAGKASGETMLGFTALVGLPPLANFFGQSLAGFGLTLLAFLIFAVIDSSKNPGGISSIMAQAHALKLENELREKEEKAEKESEEQNIPDSSSSAEDSILPEKNENNKDETTTDLKEENHDVRLGLKDTLTTGVLSTWSGELKLPDYSYLPDRKTVTNEKRVSISIFALSSYTVVALVVYLYPLLFLDQ